MSIFMETKYKAMAFGAAGLLALATPATAAEAGSVAAASLTSAVLVSHSSSAVAHSAGHVLESGTRLVVESIRPVAEGSIIVLKSLTTGASISLHLASRAATDLADLGGQIMTISTIATGRVIEAGGEVIAYIASHGHEDMTFNQKMN